MATDGRQWSSIAGPGFCVQQCVSVSFDVPFFRALSQRVVGGESVSGI